MTPARRGRTWAPCYPTVRRDNRGVAAEFTFFSDPANPTLSFNSPCGVVGPGAALDGDAWAAGPVVRAAVSAPAGPPSIGLTLSRPPGCRRTTARPWASATETFGRLGDVTKVRDEPSEYAQAAAGYFQAQLELSRRTAEAFAGVMQKAQADTVAKLGPLRP